MNRKLIVLSSAFVAVTICGVVVYMMGQRQQSDPETIFAAQQESASPIEDAAVSDGPDSATPVAAAPAPEAAPALAPFAPFEITPADFQRIGYASEVASNYPGAKAFVKRQNGEKLVLEPNQMGQFQRIFVEANEPVEIAVEFPDASPGEPVAVVAWDGGSLPNGQISDVIYVDDAGRAFARYLASENTGTHRVGFQRGGNKPVLIADFWVGTPNRYQELN